MPDDDATPVANPWWIPRLLGRVPAGIGERDLRLVGAVALALAFFNYDIAVGGQTIKFIREEFGVQQSEIGRISAYFRLGAIPAFFLIPFADLIGRHRLFLVCVLGAGVFTAATSFAQSIDQLVLLQMAGRMFIVTGIGLSFVIVAEELPAAHRGWGAGVIAAVAGLGIGFGAVLFAVIDQLPWGWRSLFLVGGLAIAFLPRLRARVPETERFLRGRELDRDADGATTGTFLGWLRPMRELVGLYPARTLAVVLIGGLTAAATGPVFSLAADYVLTDHGWSPAQFSTFFLLGGLIGIAGNTVTGRLGDRFGRRGVGFCVFTGMAVFGYAFYSGSSWILPFVWAPLVFVATGGGVISKALATELFPTSARGTSTGWLVLLEALGAGTGLWLVSALTVPGDSIAPALTIVVGTALVAALIVLFLPETAGRELAQTSDDERSAG
jgi:putative MFS transporter